VAAKKPMLTMPMVKKRLRFRKKYKNWTEEDGTDVMFSDESMLRIINSRGTTVPSKIHCEHCQAFSLSHDLGLF
jgi:hypothetical protein